ncbi:SDR family NAD(P)-dependent oxidoreductase [Streptomyces sp. NPDC002156]
MATNLTGTVALVTGASSGIGAATARRLAEDGASVALVARRKDRLADLAAEIEKAGGTALVVEADITDRARAEAAVQQTVEHFGRLDTLVNNAGLMLLGPVVGADADEWERMIAINVQGLLPASGSERVTTWAVDRPGGAAMLPGTPGGRHPESRSPTTTATATAQGVGPPAGMTQSMRNHP